MFICFYFDGIKIDVWPLLGKDTMTDFWEMMRLVLWNKPSLRISDDLMVSYWLLKKVLKPFGVWILEFSHFLAKLSTCLSAVFTHFLSETYLLMGLTVTHVLITIISVSLDFLLCIWLLSGNYCFIATWWCSAQNV